MQNKLLMTLLVAATTLVAGCASEDGTANAGGSATPPAPSNGGHGTMTDGSSALKAQALALYTATPFTTTNDVSPHNTPAHTWLALDADHVQFLHWDHDDPAKATGLLFVGDGFRGKFCVGAGGVTRSQYDAGFVHFHTAEAPNWDAGHNAGGNDGAPTTDGWWLRHIGAADMTMTMMGMEMQVEKGEVFPLMAAGFENVRPCAP